MPTEKKKAASRANGAKSPGPKTPEGKARSSQNARTHGYSSNIMTIPGEDHERFHILRDAFVERFDPVDLVELDQVELMAFATWVIRRCCNAQKLTFTMSIEKHRDGLNKIYDGADDTWHAAWAVARETAEPPIMNIQRYHAHWRRQYRQSFNTLMALQAARPKPLAPENENLQNEPTEPLTPVEVIPEPAMETAGPEPIDTAHKKLQNEPEKLVSPMESTAGIPQNRGLISIWPDTGTPMAVRISAPPPRAASESSESTRKEAEHPPLHHMTVAA